MVNRLALYLIDEKSVNFQWGGNCDIDATSKYLQTYDIYWREAFPGTKFFSIFNKNYVSFQKGLTTSLFTLALNQQLDHSYNTFSMLLHKK